MDPGHSTDTTPQARRIAQQLLALALGRTSPAPLSGSYAAGPPALTLPTTPLAAPSPYYTAAPSTPTIPQNTIPFPLSTPSIPAPSSTPTPRTRARSDNAPARPPRSRLPSTNSRTGSRSRQQSDVLPTLPKSSWEDLLPDDFGDELAKLHLNLHEKLDFMLHMLKLVGWTVGEFLYTLFRVPDGEWARSLSTGMVVSWFLRGQTAYTPIQIVEQWFKDPAGRPKPKSDEYTLMYSSRHVMPYIDIHHIRPALASFAVQVVEGRLAKEQRNAVKGPNGLHGSHRTERGRYEICWKDIGRHTVKTAQELAQEHQPLAWTLLLQLATPRPYKNENGVSVVRKTRPPELVATEVISILNFSHTQHARLMAAARGLLLAATSASRIQFDYSSRIGFSQNWSTVLALLKRLSKVDAELVRGLGSDLVTWLFITLDNVQRQSKPWEERIGREATMMIGVASMAIEAIDFDPRAYDLDDHLRRVRESRREDLTADSFLSFVDWEHVERVGALQWLQALVNYVPELALYKSEVSRLFRTTNSDTECYGAGKLPLPPTHKTKIHPLATIGKDEAKNPELRDAVADILEQVGQTHDKHVRRLVPFGGDGLTFEKLVTMKNYLQFQSNTNAYDTLQIVWPFLEAFHTGWAFVSHVYETHWGDKLTRDPARLGHSSTKINRKPPTNLKKVDYYPAVSTLTVVLQAHRLDCWRAEYGVESTDKLLSHFKHLADTKKLPSFQELLRKAASLHQRYSSRNAYSNVLRGQTEAGAAVGIAKGSVWTSPPTENTITATPPATSKKPRTKEPPPRIPCFDPFHGDESLARAILLMHDGGIAEEFVQAVAEGDPGRVYEMLKIMVFSFAGSSHSKYTGYTREQVCILELESREELKTSFLKNWIINPSGKKNKYQARDFRQEGNNLSLEEIGERKNIAWDSPFMRDTYSRNIEHLSELKLEWGEGVGLARRSSNHTDPHLDPELRILLDVYQKEELHLFRAGRTYDAKNVGVVEDSFEIGYNQMADGKLKKWINNWKATRGPVEGQQVRVAVPRRMNEVEEGEEDEDDDSEEAVLTDGYIEMVDGQLVQQWKK
ncbi:hypothetical protein EIP91_003797 [Steccherinum ochraceum]|uniref:DUF6589 domain-containing protein n=1 Tax=Steccherinum ochraceum TaxID=92696 RepID=A0A4R0RDA6_9APHY|nr:hypothetical protein EIP91_003797 [Steccherinum ochraceum]